MSPHRPRRHRGGRPGSTAALPPPSRPNRTSVVSNGTNPGPTDLSNPHSSPIRRSYGEQTESSPQPTASDVPGLTGGSGLAGLLPPTSSSASGPRVFPLSLPFGRHLAAGSPASGQPPSSRATETRRPGRGLPRAASRPLPPPSRPRRVWRPSPHLRLCSSPHKRDRARSLNGTSCGTPGVSLYSHRKPRPPRDPSAEMRSGTTLLTPGPGSAAEATG